MEGSDAPLVYVTFGTVLGHMSIAAAVYRATLLALEGQPVRVLLTTGYQFDRAQLPVIRPEVDVAPWVDQAEVFAQADLVVCHGGSGTVFGALAAGIPLVVVPLFADQFHNGRLVAQAGAGLTVEASLPSTEAARRPIGIDDVPRIASAVSAVLGAPSFRQCAGGVGAEMAATPAVDDVLDDLLRGPKRSLI